MSTEQLGADPRVVPISQKLLDSEQTIGTLRHHTDDLELHQSIVKVLTAAGKLNPLPPRRKFNSSTQANPQSAVQPTIAPAGATFVKHATVDGSDLSPPAASQFASEPQ